MPESKLSESEFSSLFADDEKCPEDSNEMLISPQDGQLIDPKDVDGLIDAYEYAQESSRQLRKWIDKLRESIASLCEGERKTERVRGNRRIAKVTFPDPTWDQSKLKEAWHAFPKLRDELLSLSSLRVKKREFKKAVGTTGPADFETFKKIIQSAERKPTAAPSVTIEGDV